MSLIKKEFVERRSGVVSDVPVAWTVGPGGFYQLDFKMCQLKELRYHFRWEQQMPEATHSVTEQPDKILIFSVSLNDLTELTEEGLVPFTQLRVLDASLNRIHRYVGVGVLKHLYSLNLAHNHINQIHGLGNLQSLVELDLSVNRLTDLSQMPSLSSLAILRINNNQLRSLDGIQALSQLRELFVQGNKLNNIVPLSSSLRLTVLHAADNIIDTLYTTVEVLKGLPRLQILCLYGNPIEKENNYQSQLLELTTVENLDNINVRAQPRNTKLHFSGNMSSVREACKQAFYSQMQEQKLRMEENVRYMKARIVALQDEYHQYEERMTRDLETCLGYLDQLSTDELRTYDVGSLRDRLRSPVPKPWEHTALPKMNNFDTRPLYPQPRDLPQHSYKPPGKKKNYEGIIDTDEVLRHVYNELSDNVAAPSEKAPPPPIKKQHHNHFLSGD